MAKPTTDAGSWVQFDHLTQAYVTGDKTSVSAEVVDSAQCFADVLHISEIRANQRAARARLEPKP